MTTLVRPIPSLAAVLMISGVVLLGCSSDPAAAPMTSQQSAAPVVDSGSTEPTDTGSAEPTSAGSVDATTGSVDATTSGDVEPTSAGSADPTSSGGAATGGPARIMVSGAICAFLEKKIPVAEMATLSGQAVDRTVEMGEDWCVYGASEPGKIVTVQYQLDGKRDFDLLGADGTPVDTTTLGVPMYVNQDLNEVYFLDGTTQWTVSVGSSTDGADPAKYAAAVTIAQRLLA